MLELWVHIYLGLCHRLKEDTYKRKGQDPNMNGKNFANLATICRPSRFEQIVGQEKEVKVLQRMLTEEWRVPALLIGGPFGTGKTTLARITARSLLCGRKNGSVEPCGSCEDCQSMDSFSHPNFMEIDAAGQGLVSDVKRVLTHVQFRVGNKPNIIYYDEAHMLSVAAQNTLLNILEEGALGVTYILATTETHKILPTIRSRCLELDLRLLKTNEIARRLKQVAHDRQFTFEDRAMAIIATYSRGHLRDAIMLLGQIVNTTGVVSESAVRDYLRVDRDIEVIKLLSLKETKDAVPKLQDLLCSHAPVELQELMGQSLLRAFKLDLGVEDYGETDNALLRKMVEAQGVNRLLEMAESLLRDSYGFRTIDAATARILNVVWPSSKKLGRRESQVTGTMNRLMDTVPTVMRKPGTNEAG